MHLVGRSTHQGSRKKCRFHEAKEKPDTENADVAKRP